MYFVDSHSHLDAPEFDLDRADVFDRCRSIGVFKQIIPAVSAESWPKLRLICQQFVGLYPSYGLHPMYLSMHKFEHIRRLREWIQSEQICAVGECGLDFFMDDPQPELQRYYFVEQLKLARDFNLPVILHARKALEEVIQLIKQTGVTGGVVHSFSGSESQAEQLFKLNFCLGIGGPITYARANRLRNIVEKMPIEFLLLETDSPDQPLFGFQGERNDPTRLLIIAETVASLRGESLNDLAQKTTQNAMRMFAIN